MQLGVNDFKRRATESFNLRAIGLIMPIKSLGSLKQQYKFINVYYYSKEPNDNGKKWMRG